MRVTKEPEERRAELVAAAQELFDRNGIRNTQVSQIAEKVGVAKGLFYYYFSSKDEVVDEVIGITLAGMEEKLEKLLQNQKLSFYGKAAAFVQMYLDMIDRFSGDEEDNLNSMLEAIADNRIARNRNRLLVQQTHRLIDQGVEEGILTTAWPHETVRVLIQGFLGASREKLLAVDKVIAILEQSLGLPEGALMQEYEKLSETESEQD